LPAYDELDTDIAWRPAAGWRLAVQGANLLQARHLEFPLPYGEYIDRSVMLQASWQR